jgi:broad specificity phosphatase PhoE
MLAPVIYYIRHGETSWNAQGRLQGTQDIALNDLGRRQAAHAGNVLADLLARDGRDKAALPFVASPLQRARVTMELVRGALKLPAETYALDDRLREIGYGVWEGSTLAEMQAADPELYARRLTAKWTMAPKGGETYAEVQQRMRDWYDCVKGDTVAVAHGGTARALMVALGIETPASAADLPIEQGAVYVFGEGGLRKYS